MIDGLRAVRAAVAGALSAGSASLALERLCRACVIAPGVSGAALCLADGVSGYKYRLVAASEQSAAELSEAQFAAGWGPGPDALGAGAAVLAEDLTAPVAQQRWPFFTPLALEAGIRALHSVPIVIGTAPAGTLDVFFTHSIPQSAFLPATTQLVADAAAEVITQWCALHEGRPFDALPDSAGDADFARVHQASGMLAVRLGVTPDEALARMRARAFHDGVSLAVLASGIVDREPWPGE